MPATATALLFGDQTSEVLPSIEALNRKSLHSLALRTFFRRSTDRLRAAMARAPAVVRHQLPASFESPLELAQWASSTSSSSNGHLPKTSPAVAAALLSIAQLGHVVAELESNPNLLQQQQQQQQQHNHSTVLLGTCTGILAAIAVACSHGAADLLSIADEVVELAFRVGLVGVRRTATIDDSSDAASSTSSASWATLVTNIADVAAVEDAIARFNATSVLAADRHAYISARGLSPSTLTVSGPPSTTAALFASASVFEATRRFPLPIAAAFHAPHLSPVSVESVLCPPSAQLPPLSAALLGRTLRPDVTLLSAGAGRPYAASASFSALLAEALRDIFQEPILLGSAVDGLARALDAPTAMLVTFGPSNTTRAFQRDLEARGMTVDCKADSAADADVPSPGARVPPPPPGDDAIAIVGMASRLPGSETLEAFWQVLEQGRDLHEPIRADRFDVVSHVDASGQRRNTSLTPYGVFVDRPGFFDTRLFNMSPREAAQTDPQMRMLLLTTYEALEMAGYAPGRTPSTAPRRVGSFIGQTSDDYRDVNASQDVDTYFITGGIRAFGPGRLNYHFGWEGPSYSVDTACSSSAAAIQLACTSLAARECDTAVAGGANFLTASDLFAGLSRGSFLSKTGGCKTFDADADGYVRADGVAVVVLKRLASAVADHDNILAVIRAAVTNHSAEAVSITHPHAATQERLFRTALDRAGLQPHDIDYAELHGTGTQAGDATESRSVTNVLARGRTRDQPLYVGTVKPNLGHGEAASGVTSLIKAVLMMRHSAIPPHVGIKGRMNPKLPPFAELNTHIAMTTTPFLPRADWDAKRRILINNFDAAGGNTSIVIEDAPVVPSPESSANSPDPRLCHVITVSGRTANALVRNSQRLLDYVRAHPDCRLQDLAYTTTARRMHHSLRQAHVASSIDGLVASLEAAARNADAASQLRAPSAAPPVVFCFTGQGSQYAGMAADLFAGQPAFRDTMLDCDRIARGHGFASVLPVIVDRTATAFEKASPVQMQLAIVSIELSLVAFWRSLGVVPAAVVGHSLGEYAALCTAGVLSLSDCLCLVGHRASLMLAKCAAGSRSMLALACPQDEAAALLSGTGFGQCEIACVNGPSATVVSGPVDDIARLHETATVKATRLDVQFAFHSAQMDPIMDEFAIHTAKACYSPPSIPVASTLLGAVIPAGNSSSAPSPIDGTYLVRQMRESVRFTDALQSLLADASIQPDRAMWLEAGPSPICLGMARSVLAGASTHRSPIMLPSMKRGESDWKIVAQAVAKAYEAGVEIDWREYHAAFESELRLVELPAYAFDLKNYWIQYRGDWALRKGDAAETQSATVAPMTHAQVASYPAFSPTTGLHRIKSQAIRKGEVEVAFATDAAEHKLNKALRGHLVNGAGLCPSSVLGDMALTAASYIRRLSQLPSEAALPCLSSDLCLDVHDMGIHKPLLVQPGDTSQVIVTTAKWDTSTATVHVTFSSHDGTQKPREEHAHCEVTFSDVTTWQSAWRRNAHLVRARMDQLVEASSQGRAHKLLRPMVYKLFATFVDYADRYQGLQEVYMDSHQLEAAANVQFRTSEADGTFVCSPYWIDSLAHLSGFILNGADTTPPDSVFISHGWGSLKISAPLSADKLYRSYVRMQEEAGSRGVYSGDVFFFEGDAVIAMCEDLKFQRIKRSILPHLLPSGERPSLATKPAKTLPAATTEKTPASRGISSAVRATTTDAANNDTSFSVILDAVASEVGIDESELADDALFADLGVDSLLAISITAKLSAVLGRQLPATLFTECLDVSQLRTYFSDYSNNGAATGSDKRSHANANNDPPRARERTGHHVRGRERSGSASSAYSTVDTPLTSIGQTPPDTYSHTVDLLRLIIATEVGVDPAEVEEDTLLADLGVDSLLSLSILGSIKEKTGKVLPSSFLMDHPTLKHLQFALGGPSHVSPQALVRAVEKAAEIHSAEMRISHVAEAVLLQGSPLATMPTLFLLPDGSGSASSYVGLPPMSVYGAVYGINSPFLDDPRAFSASLSEVASMYIAEIRRLQPHGPYNLGGWSIGGSYAFEAARQLAVLHKETISSLVLIDAPCPKTLPPLPSKTIDLLQTIGAFDGLKDHASKMRSGIRDHFAGSVNALKQYKPEAIPEWASPKSTMIVWAQDGVWETVGEAVRRQHVHEARRHGENAAQDWIMDPRKDTGPNGWDNLLPGTKIVCKVVPGDHFTIMRRPGVADVGRQLCHCISEEVSGHKC